MRFALNHIATPNLPLDDFFGMARALGREGADDVRVVVADLDLGHPEVAGHGEEVVEREVRRGDVVQGEAHGAGFQA